MPYVPIQLFQVQTKDENRYYTKKSFTHDILKISFSWVLLAL